MMDFRTLLLGLLIGLAPAAALQAAETLQTVDQVDLERYLGTWYQISNMPAWFQRKCIADTTATYSQNPDGGINVLNRCRTKKGFDDAEGYARITDAPRNSKLEVSFFSLLGWRPAWGDYWVIALADDYSWVIVGEPGRKYGWILARTPTLPSDLQADLEQRMADVGYDIAQLERQPHGIGDDEAAADGSAQ